jgi:hypothetical protein
MNWRPIAATNKPSNSSRPSSRHTPCAVTPSYKIGCAKKANGTGRVPATAEPITTRARPLPKACSKVAQCPTKV